MPGLGLGASSATCCGGCPDAAAGRRRPASGRMASARRHRPGHSRAASARSSATPGVLRLLRRRSLAALRDEVEPVSAPDFARFLPSWQGVGELRGVRRRAARGRAAGRRPGAGQRAGVAGAAGAGPRLPPRLLDELTAAGEVLWQGTVRWPAPTAGSRCTPPSWRRHPRRLRARLPDDLGDRCWRRSAVAGYFFRRWPTGWPCADDELTEALWDLVWAGRLTNDTLAPAARPAGPGRPAHRSRPVARRADATDAPSPRVAAAAPNRSPRGGRTLVALPELDPDPTARAVARAELLLDRYGVVTRGSVAAEGSAGRLRRRSTGCSPPPRRPDGCAAATSSRASGPPSSARSARSTGCGRWPVRWTSRRRTRPGAGRCRPGQPLRRRAGLAGASRPDGHGHQPGRKAGALVVLVDGGLVLYVERGGRTLLSWTDDPAPAGTRGRGAGRRRARRGAGQADRRRWTASRCSARASRWPWPWPRPGSA